MTEYRRIIMRKKEISAYEIAQRFVGIKEVQGSTANPQILSMLNLTINGQRTIASHGALDL